jgi:hypothetical protein
MFKTFTSKTAALAAVGVLSLGGGAYAATSGSNAPTPLSSNVFESASTAALAKYPGATIVGLQSRGDGTFEAEVRKTDGTEVDVELDKDFKVTGTHAGGHGGPGGPGGHGGPGRDDAALAKALGVTQAKLRAAQEAIHSTKTDPRTAEATALAKALDATTADVQAVLDAQGPGRGYGRPGDDSALVTALAKKTGKTEAEVTTALKTVRTDRQDAEATALAKELGLDAAKVKSALAAAKPAGRP